MWYILLEQQRQWLRAWHAAAGYACDAWPAAISPRAAPPGYADWFEPLLGLAAGRPPFSIDSVTLDGRRYDVDEQVIAHTPFCDLRRFASRCARAPAPRAVLLCAPLAGHAAVMMRETVEALLTDGDVYLTDWADARDVPLAAGRFGLNEYVTMLDGFIDTLARDKRPLHIVAVCRQSTVPALGALALRAQRRLAPPASIALIGGPLDARVNPSTLGIAAQTHSLDWCRHHLMDIVPAGFAGHGRHVFPAWLQQAEIAFVYPHRYLSLMERYAQAACRCDAGALADARRVLREYIALLDMPAEYFLDTVDVVFQHARLASRTWRVGGASGPGGTGGDTSDGTSDGTSGGTSDDTSSSGTLVDPAALRDVVLLTVEGTRDGVTGAGQTHAALEMCSGIAPDARLRFDVDGCDHYGLFTGERWRDEVHPALQAVFAQSEAHRSSASRRSSKRAASAHVPST